MRKISGRELKTAIIRGAIIFGGLLTAGGYGMRHQWPAALLGLTAAVIAAVSGRKRKL